MFVVVVHLEYREAVGACRILYHNIDVATAAKFEVHLFGAL